MLACPVCECHVRASEPSCPHCGAALSAAAPNSRLGAVALMAGLSLFGCVTGGDDVAEGGTTTMMGTTTDTSESGSETSTTDPTTTTTTTTGDGDGDWAESEAAYGVPDIPCGELDPVPVMAGNNAIAVDMSSNWVYASCGIDGSGNLFAFTSEADANFEVSLIDADFENPVVALIGYTCEPPEELSCALPPETQMITMTAGETVHILVGPSEGSVEGSATLVIAELEP